MNATILTRSLRPLRGLVCALAVGALTLDAGAQTNPFAGLWSGNVTIDGISDANPIASDLGFDLGIQAQLVQQSLIDWGATWKYFNGEINLGINWRGTYNDGAWFSGPAPLGYGNGDEATAVPYGPTATNKYPTSYYRKTFTVANPLAYASLRFRVIRDDGVVIYLNGAPILRDNLSAVYTHNTFALSSVTGTSQSQYVEITIPANLLLQTNVVSAEVHIASPSDDDMRFALELVGVVSEPSPSTLLPIRSTWKYSDSGADLGSAWRMPGYDDSAWGSGPGKLGYGDGDEATIVAFGTSTSKFKTTYFRATFPVADPAASSQLTLLLRRDDGAVVYINGVEVQRSNMPETGAITHDSEPLTVIGAADEGQYLQYTVSSSNLVVGANVVAVSVHQHPSELGEASIGTPTPTKTPLQMRVLLHVDSDGDVNLLKEVIQMWKDGVLTPTGVGSNVIQTAPGRYVLLTDEALVSQYKGVTLRDGEQVGRRISAIGFDFADLQLPMAGAFGAGETVVVTNRIAPDFRTNPFKHRYHPDHDNLSPDYQSYRQEALDITRVIALDFSSRYPPELALPVAAPPPGWGLDRIGGVYRETITGLHKQAIQVRGTFDLERISLIDRLNDQ